MLPVFIRRGSYRDSRVRHSCSGPPELESRKKNVDQFWPKLLSANQNLGHKGPTNQKLGQIGPANQKLGHWARKGQPIRNWARLGQPIRNWARKYSMTLGPIWPKMTSLYIGVNQIGPASRTNQSAPNLTTIRLC